MIKISHAKKFKQYVAECFQIVYWVYFKPYTLRTWLKDIHPQLTSYTSLWTLYINSSPRLNRFFDQICWINSLAPLLACFLIAFPCNVLTNHFDNWLYGGTLLQSWFIGIWLAQGIITGSYFRCLVKVLIVASIVFASSIIFLQPSSSTFSTQGAIVIVVSLGLGLALGVARDIAFSTTVGIAGSISFGVALGTTVGMTGSITFGVAFGVALGLASGLALCTTLGITIGVIISTVISIVLGVAFAITGSMAIGIAFTIASILGISRSCFWLPELFGMFILFFVGYQGDEEKCLRYLPPRFDELIILPLPFMVDLLIYSYGKNAPLACSNINYLINSTNQQRIAAKVMIGIATRTFNQTQTTDDIAVVHKQLAWLPSPAPKELGAFIPQFLEISESVSAYIEATSAYRQYELLNLPLKNLKELNKSLAFSRNIQQATTFGSIFNCWLNILETAQSTLKEKAKRSQEIPQVYIAGNALDPETAESRFKGRKDIFQEIEILSLSLQPPVLLFYGGRRTGKTSSLKYLPRKVGAEIIPLLIDLQGAASAKTLIGLAEYLVKEIINAARQSRNLQLPYPDQEKLSQEPFLTLQNWFAAIEATASHKRFLLCLDEFERLSEIVATTGSRVPLNFFRHILQHRPRWILLFSGSHTLEELDPYWSDYLINTRFIRLTYLQESEARELIEKPVPDFPNIYQPAAVEIIINQTRCQPYLVQLLCSTIVDRLNQEQRKLATPEDVHNSIAKTIEAGSNYFRELWTNLPEQDQDLLLRLIDGETPKPGDRMSLRRLTYKEILEKKAETYDFQVPLVKNYIEEMVF